MRKHVKNVHQTARFMCSFCDKKWTTKAQLQEHEDHLNFLKESRRRINAPKEKTKQKKV